MERLRPTRTASPSPEARRAGPRQRRLAARPLGQLRARSATCRARRAIWAARSRPTRTASPSARSSPRRTPATPAGSATSRSASSKIGDVQSAQGDLGGALKAYQDSLAIGQKLAAQDPGNAGWQRDLSVSFEQDRRRAEREGRSGRRAQGLPGQPRHRPEARRAGPRQRRLAARPLGQLRAGSATCRARRAIWAARSRPTRTASPSARSSPRRTPATPAGSAT